MTDLCTDSSTMRRCAHEHRAVSAHLAALCAGPRHTVAYGFRGQEWSCQRVAAVIPHSAGSCRSKLTPTARAVANCRRNRASSARSRPRSFSGPLYVAGSIGSCTTRSRERRNKRERNTGRLADEKIEVESVLRSNGNNQTQVNGWLWYSPMSRQLARQMLLMEQAA